MNSYLIKTGWLLLLLLSVSSVYLPAIPPEGSGYSYKLVFEDNFDGASLDTSKWNYNYPWGTYHNHQANCRAEQVSVADGKMTITAINERSIWDPWGVWHDDFGYMNLDYTSGAINTSGKFNFTRGYIEGRFKMSGAIGSWPAFWTLQGGWPPEIDILENPCWSSDVIDTYHFYYHYSPDNASFGSTKTASGLSTAYHTYGCEWTDNQMAWYFDNSQNGRWTNETAVTQSANMYLIINFAVGGWGGTPDPAQYPSTYSCDWVRVWQRVQDTTLECVGRWELDETTGTTASDSSGKGIDGTLMGGLSFDNDSTSGVIGTALSFDGVNDYVDLPDGLNELDNGFTVSLWVRPTAVKNWARFIDFGQGEANDNILLSRQGTTSNLAFQCFGGGSWGNTVIASGAIDLNTWQHFAATVDPEGNVVLYKNGQVIQTGTTTWPWGVTRTQNYIGRSNWSADDYYQGDMDDIFIYDYALSSAEIEAVYSRTADNFPPVFYADPIDKQAVVQGNAYSDTLMNDVCEFDADDVLTFSKLDGPDWLNVATDGALAGTPSAADAGDNIFTVRVMDSQGAYDDATLLIHVETSPIIAWWTFEEGTAGAEVPGTSAWTTYQVGTPDMSGNGNHLCDYWDGPTDSGITYSSNVPTIARLTNTLSGLSESGSYPSMFTWSNASSPAGIDLETAVLSAWTIEALVYPTEISGQNRGIVGRDGKRSSSDVASPLYFNIQSNGTLRCTYFDQAAIVHDVQSTVTLTTDNWYYVAATCDGTNLKLWLADLTGGETSATQVASVDVTGSTDSDFGPWLDNGRGNWSVFRGYWNSGDVDRFMGNIDEVRISAVALDINGQGLLIDNTLPPSFTIDPISNDDGIEMTDYVGDSLAAYAEDIDGIETVLFSKDAGPDWLVVADDGTLSGIPGDADVGSNVFTVRVTDNGGLYDTAAMTIEVANIYSGTQGIDDLVGLAGQWLMLDCVDVPACGGADLDGDHDVDMSDFSILANNWLSVE